MTESLFKSNFKSNQPSTPMERISGLLWKLIFATLILMAIGSATRVMNAGLACPDWPLCYGQLVPAKEMNLQVFLEWFHRLDASVIGVGAIALTGLSWWYRSSIPQWLPFASSFALFLVVFQGILGALTVTELLRFDLVTAHLGTALLFFTTLIIIAMAILPYQPVGNVGKLPWISVTTTVLIYVQSLLGALVGSQWALHQCFNNYQLCVVMNSHIIGVIPPTLGVLILVIMTKRTPALNGIFRKLANVAGGLLVLQITLGIATFWLHLQVEPLTVSHQTVGATLLGVLVAYSVLAIREKQSISTMVN